MGNRRGKVDLGFREDVVVHQDKIESLQSSEYLCVLDQMRIDIDMYISSGNVNIYKYIS